jgi:endonuclease G
LPTLRKTTLFLTALLALLFFSQCKHAEKQNNYIPQATGETGTPEEKPLAAPFTEDFETGSKGAYREAHIMLGSGEWDFDNASIGNTNSDRKNGSKSVRIQKNGTITTLFELAGGEYKISIAHGVFSMDAASTWGLWYTNTQGGNWAQAGGNITTSSINIDTALFTVNTTGNTRFQLRKLSGGRLNIDDFSVTEASGKHKSPHPGSNEKAAGSGALSDGNMALGNPSGATTRASGADNYLIVKKQYALSYNNSKGMANWVSWHLSAESKGAAERCNCFEPDASLPQGFFRATTHDYTGTGFDRGHLCPSDDRDKNNEDNAATFLMTNMSPQAPHLNQQTWETLEAYCRKLVSRGNELYIIAGGYGTGGMGSKGTMENSIADGKINVPSHFWKIVVVLPAGSNVVTSNTRVIAVDMPNVQTVNGRPWDYYRTSVSAIEKATGYNFLSALPAPVQSAVESKTDDGPTH